MLSDPKQPADMAKYYPNNYYYYAAGSGRFVDALKRRTQIMLSLHGPAWLFAGRDWWEVGVRKSIRDMGLSRSARILDVGCGNGNLIASLAEVGFHNVLGADPFIPHDIVHSNGARP
jgi:SAM-dependent methyltransferase